MAHSFDVFEAAGTHACSCQSNGGLARAIIKCILKLTCVLPNPVFLKHQWIEPSNIYFLIYGYTHY